MNEQIPYPELPQVGDKNFHGRLAQQWSIIGRNWVRLEAWEMAREAFDTAARHQSTARVLGEFSA
jgi:hypothetical protein